MKERSKTETTPIPSIYYDSLQEVNQHELSSEIAAILLTFPSSIQAYTDNAVKIFHQDWRLRVGENTE